MLEGGITLKRAILCEDNIILNARFDNKWDAIRACGDTLVKNGYVYKEYVERMVDRERGATVYIGNNLAIPHGTDGSEPYIITSGISVLQVPDGVQFEDGIAYILIGIAGRDGEHIKILGSIATVCSDIGNVQKLREAKDKKVICNILEEIEVI
ncbi:phosphoenolpyruvate-dependent sugar phosphotransferase system EIIA 2 [Clostridium sp. DL-VIII]|nr:phosphoenolpyruvate-dependent sugar phosphotransferase system EIIA 2 [Clostridium sp. DL-VIII]